MGAPQQFPGVEDVWPHFSHRYWSAIAIPPSTTPPAAVLGMGFSLPMGQPMDRGGCQPLGDGAGSSRAHRNQNGCTSKSYPLKYETGKKASQEVATPHARDAYDINKPIRIRNI